MLPTRDLEDLDETGSAESEKHNAQIVNGEAVDKLIEGAGKLGGAASGLKSMVSTPPKPGSMKSQLAFAELNQRVDHVERLVKRSLRPPAEEL